MFIVAKRLPLIALGVVVVLATATASAQAQAVFRSGSALADPYAYGSDQDAGFRRAPVYNPYYAYSPYPSYGDPYGGFLSGAANVINAQGELTKQLQQAEIMKEYKEQAKIDTRRKAFDEYLYERAVRPSVEDDREKERIQALRRARNDPPITEIWSGRALNDLLLGIQQMQAQRRPGPIVPLDEDVLLKINVTSGASGNASLGVLRDGGEFHWPLTLRTSFFRTERTKLDKLAQQAFQQARAGQVDADTLVAMNEAVDNLHAQLKRNISKVSANDYIKSKRYLNDLEKTVKALDDPNVGKVITRKWAANGDTVAVLVKNMTREGLRFAPAVQGDEAAYVALQRAMVAYYTLPPAGNAWDPLAK